MFQVIILHEPVVCRIFFCDKGDQRLIKDVCEHCVRLKLYLSSSELTVNTKSGWSNCYYHHWTLTLYYSLMIRYATKLRPSVQSFSN